MTDTMQLEKIIRRERTQISNAFIKAAKDAHNEREFQTAAAMIIEDFAKVADIELPLREEYTLFNGRADAVYNRFIIEYEPPSSLRDKNSFRHNQHAIEQVKEYLIRLVRHESRKSERLAGVVFNGDYFIWVRQREGVWHIDQPIKVDPTSTERFLRTICSLSTERALIPENLVGDFGENTDISRLVVSALYKQLTQNSQRRTEVLFQQWSQQFSEVCDYDQASKVDVATHARSYAIKGSGIDSFRFFFCIHTYYAYLIKLLAVQIVHFYLMPKLGTDLRQAGAKNSEDLRRYLLAMENGGIFRQFGVNNLMEGDFFGWYLDAWCDEIEVPIREVINALGKYSIDTLDIDQDTSRDLLKHLYQNLMPKPLRHNLGEYYTPDWLAERTLGLLDGVMEETVHESSESGKASRLQVYLGDPNKRLLDPACGSGTFLVMAIRRIREYGWRNTIPERELLQLILRNVVGFDLNPLAVVSARTNYLLALGDLLQHRGENEINIPVYLCDSVLTPTKGSGLFDNSTYSFKTSVGIFTIPSSLVSGQQIDELANLLEESVQIQLDEDDFSQKVCQQFQIDQTAGRTDIDTLTNLYKKLCVLENDGIDGIWARIIKNAFAPLFVGRFDLVAGNPPWVNWEHLPEQYRRSIAPLWQKYDLFRHEGMKARLGGAKDDISILMFYVTADQYLKRGGKIAFVITQTVFKSEGGGEGFRRFRCGAKGPNLRVIFVDDWSNLKPFEGAANKTAVVIAQRDAATRYPVSVNFWRKRAERTKLSEDAPLQQVVYEICRLSQWIGEPLDDARPDSIWITGRKKTVRALKRVVGTSDYTARKGVDCSANGCYWVEPIANQDRGIVVVKNYTEGAKRRIDIVQGAVEADILFPLLRGRDVGKFSATPDLKIILPHRLPHGDKAITEKILKTQFPKAYAFLHQFKNVLESRKSYLKFLKPANQPFYATFNTGDYTFSRIKVVWREQASTLVTAVVVSDDKQSIVPDHKLVMIPFSEEDKEEAYYVGGLLSTTVARCIVTFSMVTTQISTNVMKYVPIKKFDGENQQHRIIAGLCMDAHQATRRGDVEEINTIERKIDAAAGELWGISAEEMEDMRASLKDVGVTQA
ncbi:MAG: SAM-dependent DNA methyltransferase [Kiritimatiellae bacterium]|nr:SAM-dependent DNA methyltransferase [Kiritimatiellia bacterium]